MILDKKCNYSEDLFNYSEDTVDCHTDILFYFVFNKYKHRFGHFLFKLSYDGGSVAGITTAIS